jgi:hypothetical protein
LGNFSLDVVEMLRKSSNYNLLFVTDAHVHDALQTSPPVLLIFDLPLSTCVERGIKRER